MPEHRGRLGPDQVDHQAAPVGGGQPSQLPQQHLVGARYRGRRRTAGAPHQRAEQRRDLTERLQRRQVEPDRRDHRRAAAQDRVEECQALGEGEQVEPRGRQPAEVGLAELAGHAGVRRPRTPHQGQARHALGAAVLSQRVQVGVGRRVAAQPRAADQPGH
ncbi:hypothetical protein Amac_038330 [Acrocarpospora macrocephala]|uniref:Uncharacterized protein n=1 Tax=Acrocarpospora macrocephala TaxID=150177 RepID=A0A5M3WNQ5_9ACTN|nr:hypothetical protein Amac_038330 [Acrocarpospora macrocephala]